MILQTARLRLRPFRADDVAPIASYSTGPDFARFMPLPPQTLESAGEFVGRVVAEGQRDAKSDWHFALQLGETVRPIGAVRIGTREAEHRQGDVGYALHPDHWGKGYTTEALVSLLTFGFEHLSFERIWAVADVDNIASWRVMEKAGMQREGILRHHRLIRGAWRDSVLYARINAG